MDNNRQLRNMIFLLYPDNEKHLNALEQLKSFENSLLIDHKELKDEKGELIHKDHWHCILWHNNPVWVSTVCNSLGLSEEDYHLFRSIRDPMFKRFKTIDDYIVYLTHIFEDNKIDKYSIDDFIGGRVEYAREVLNKIDKSKAEIFLDLVDFCQRYSADHIFELRSFTFGDWYRLCCENGYGKIFYENWYKMRDILKAYLYF